MATDSEVLHFIDQHALSGRGIGYIDAHLLAAVKLTGGAALWTHDKRLHQVADSLGYSAGNRQLVQPGHPAQAAFSRIDKR